MKCLLVDDHVVIRDALAMLIRTYYPSVQVFQASTLAEAISTLQSEFDLVLLDLNLPDSSGIQTVESIRASAPQARVIVLSANDTEIAVLAALQAGAASFISKSADSETLLRSIHRVLEGKLTLPATILEQANISTKKSSQVTLMLSDRQMDVLSLVIDGQTNKSICQQLGLSESTVKTHIAAIFNKLGVNNRTQAVVEAARQGISLNDLRK